MNRYVGGLVAKWPAAMDDIDDRNPSLARPAEGLCRPCDNPLRIARKVVDDPDLKIHDEHGACVPIQRDWLSHDAPPVGAGGSACAAGLRGWRLVTWAAGPCGRRSPDRSRWLGPLTAG